MCKPYACPLRHILTENLQQNNFTLIFNAQLQDYQICCSIILEEYVTERMERNKVEVQVRFIENSLQVI